jgi:hypothetical protein
MEIPIYTPKMRAFDLGLTPHRMRYIDEIPKAHPWPGPRQLMHDMYVGHEHSRSAVRARAQQNTRKETRSASRHVNFIHMGAATRPVYRYEL